MRALRDVGHFGTAACAVAATMTFAVPAMAEDGGSPSSGGEATLQDGILPSLSAILPADSPLRLRFPKAAASGDEAPVYTRRLPIGGQEAVVRGVTLPEPFGVSLTFVDNFQAQNIGGIAVALGKGSAPPPGTDLVDLPFVALENVESDTRTAQVRADFWLYPFLNVFGALGTVDGDVDLDVVVDLDQTPLCPPVTTCGTRRAGFRAGVATNTATIGATAVYGWENWFATLSLSATASFGENTDYAINSYSGSARLGRRWLYGPGHVLSPYIGVSYLDLDQEVEGVTRLPDAFPDGESLEVRYRAQVENTDKWSAAVGLNLGFVSGYALSLETSFSENNARSVLSATYRF